jgi:hypothetical protein
MTVLLRQLLAIALLPFTVTVLVPVWIARRFAVGPALGGSAGELLLQAAGAVAGGVGVAPYHARDHRVADEPVRSAYQRARPWTPEEDWR